MASAEPPRSYAFGPYLFEPAEHRLSRNGVRVTVTPKVLDTLRVLVEPPGKLVEKDELMKRLWPDAFVQEAALARHISDLRRALGEPARGGQYIETVPTRGYRFIADVRTIEPEDGTSQALQAPSADETAEVAVVDHRRGDDRSRETVHSASPAWVRLAVGGLILAAVVGGWRLSRPARQTEPLRSIAVLPFQSGGDSEDDRILAQGLADTLISRLTQIPGLGVRPIDAVRELGESPTAPRELGRRLRVDAVLTGTIVREGPTLRVAASLLRVEDGRALWSAAFEDAGGSLFAIEQTIAVQMAVAIVPVLGHDAQARLSRQQAHHAEANLAYMRGRYFWGRRTREGLDRAVALLEHAVRLDPAFALGHAALADAYVLLGGLRVESDTIPRAQAAARRALELDPALGEAHAALGLIAMNYDWDWAGAERAYQTAIRLSPQYATAHQWYGEYLGYMGRFDEALAEMERASELDPLSLIIGTDTGKVLFVARRYDDAIARLRRTLDLDPSYPLARGFLALALSATGNHAEAIAAAQLPGHEDDPFFLVIATYVYEQAGRTQEARTSVGRLIELSGRQYVSPFLLAFAHVGIGDFDAAFAASDRMCDERGLGAIAVKMSPLSDPVRHDPRFAVLLKRLGLP
jgi:DNA-binding winged helix-turn-helix (wHTH) protein/TolB-like protein/Flp pilus assembly protein TadD